MLRNLERLACTYEWQMRSNIQSVFSLTSYKLFYNLFGREKNMVMISVNLICTHPTKFHIYIWHHQILLISSFSLLP